MSACAGSCTSGAQDMGTATLGATAAMGAGTKYVFSKSLAPANYPAGFWVKVSGCSVAGYNGDWPITASTSSSVTVQGGASGLGASTGCKVVAEWPQTATGTVVDNQITWTADGAQNCRSDVFVMELR